MKLNTLIAASTLALSGALAFAQPATEAPTGTPAKATDTQPAPEAKAEKAQKPTTDAKKMRHGKSSRKEKKSTQTQKAE